jgi:hypothetical protein
LAHWNGVTAKQVSEHGGKGLLKRYNDSVRAALKEVYPTYSPPIIEKEKKNHISILTVRMFFDDVAKKLRIYCEILIG